MYTAGGRDFAVISSCSDIGSDGERSQRGGFCYKTGVSM